MKNSVDLSYNIDDGCWYKTGDDIVYTGELVEYNDNGEVISKTKFNAGKIDGVASTWHDNGRKKSEIYFSRGLRDGLATWWDERGRKKTQHGTYSAFSLSDFHRFLRSFNF